MGIKEEFGKQIKRKRIEKHLTQEKLSEMVDISQRSLSKIEAGENFVSSDTIDKLMLALNITMEELFSTSYLKSNIELRTSIDEKLNLYMDDREKLETIYKIIINL